MLNSLVHIVLACMLMTGAVSQGYGQVLPQAAGQADVVSALSPEQRAAIEQEVQKTGGVVTPETVRSLQDNPEFEGLTPEDIARGKELLHRKEASKPGAVSEERSATKEQSAERGEGVVSLFDKYRTVRSYQDISLDLKPFGYRFFSQMTGRQMLPRRDIPVSDDYIIGPGDEVKLLLWGRVNAKYSLPVDRDGNITIPEIGPVQVAGMQFEEMRAAVARQVEQIVGANMSMTMGALKSIQVFVLGEVRSPGSYALDSFSTITGAILAAGGPTGIGSLRNIELKRNNKTIAVMDFYNFLLRGDKSHDRLLQSGDVVFIPTAGPLVGIAGNIKRPAIYELKDRKDLMNLFDIAGGVMPSAYTQQIQVERIQKNERQIVIDIDDKNLEKAQHFLLHDGDLVKVFSIVEMDVNVVYLQGNVRHPGKYEYREGMKVSDLIPDGEELLRETHFDYALIKRMKPPVFGKELIPFDLGKLIFEKDGAQDIPLEPQDAVFVFSKWIFQDRPTVSVEGEVRKAGTFPLPENYTVRDAILEAGGLTRDASSGKGELFRTGEQGDITQLYFNVDNAMAETPADNIVLQDRDRIVIHSLWEEKYRQTVFIGGEVTNPGDYPLARGMKVSDLIFAAGNILESAYLEDAEVFSYSVVDGQSIKTDYRTIHLGGALAQDPVHDLELQPRDRVFVKRIPEWRETRFASVAGEVRFPGSYSLQKGEGLSSLLERAGGYTEEAYLRGAVFTRQSVRVMQQQSIDEMVGRLERELLSGGAVQASTAVSREEVDAKKVELEQKEKLIASLKKLKATGRMAIHLAHLRLLKNSEYDIQLEDGDSLYIPEKNSVVTVAGAVMSQGSFIYADRHDYKDYIEMSGGYTAYSDKKNVYVLKVDGSARKLATGSLNWNIPQSRWEVSAFGESVKTIEPGDTIVVPEKLDRMAWMRNVKDLTQILYQIAVTAGVIIVAF